MLSTKRLTSTGTHLGIVAALFCCLSAFPIRANAQGAQGAKCLLLFLAPVPYNRWIIGLYRREHVCWQRYQPNFLFGT
jgi:hypothetical protein